MRTPRMAHAVFPCDLASKSETGEHRVDMAPSTGNLQGNHRQMVRITIDAPPERASTFAQVIESEGLHVTSCTSMERRSGELSEVARIVYRVAGTAAVNGQFVVPTGGQQKYPPLLVLCFDDRGSFP